MRAGIGVWALAFGAVAPAGAQQADFVYISNVVGVAEGGAPGSIEDQTARALDRLGVALREHGLEYADVVVANVFLTDTRHFQAMNQIYRRYFTERPPTRATVAVDLPDPDALIQLSVVATGAAKRVIAPRRLASPSLPYSWGIAVGNTLFVAGATSRNPDTYAPEPGDVAAQTRRVLGNIGFVLEEAGMDYGDLVSCRVFLDDPRRFGEMNGAYGEFMPAEDPPARAAVRAALMNPAFDTEIQCVAQPSGSRRVVVAEGRSRARSPLSPGIATGDRLYLSGLVGRGPDGVPADVVGQTSNTLDNLYATLVAAGMDFSHVVDTWVFVTDIRQWPTVQRVLGERLPADAPPPTVVGAALMGSGLLVEIQMVAVRRD